VLGEIGLTPRAKTVLKLAEDEARRLNHDYVGTEHILLGLVREGEGIAAGVLESLGVNLEKVRRETLHVLDVRDVQGQAPRAAPAQVRVTDGMPPVFAGRASAEGGRFDKFTERARKVLDLAQEEAQRFNHNCIGTEHLLLGLVRVGEGTAERVLANLDIELRSVRAAVERETGRGDRIVLGEIGLTPRAKKVIELAVDEARRLNHHYIGTEHLLLGLMREGEGVAAQVLNELGVNLEMVRTQTMRVLSQSGDMRAQPASGTLLEREANPRESGAAEATGQLSALGSEALRLAREEARRLHADVVEPAHLLLGVLRTGDERIADLLRTLGIDTTHLYRALDRTLNEGRRGYPTDE
jgi:ATP-dependent Clp protease ATP-binding subunit ClpA